MFHWISTVVYVETSYYCTNRQKSNKLHYLFTMVLPYMLKQQIGPQMPCIQITQYTSIGEVCQYIYATYELSATNHMTRSTLHRQHQMMMVAMQDDNNTAWLHMLSWPLAKSAKSIATYGGCKSTCGWQGGRAKQVWLQNTCSYTGLLE